MSESDLLTPREWLMMQGLAKPGKGKFSAAANEALAKARDEGMKFNEPVKPEPKQKAVKVEQAPRAERPAPAEKPERVKHNVDPSAVRKWAKENDIDVNERGRLSSETVQAYVDAHADNPEAMKERKDPAVADLRQEAPRRYRNDSFTAKDIDGSTIRKSFKDCCYRCHWSLGWCQCVEGPITFSHVDTVTEIALSAA